MDLESSNLKTNEKKWKRDLVGWISMIVFVLAFVVIIRGFLFTNYIVNGHSMMPTIHDHERVIINKISYDIGSPNRFEMIVFHANNQTDYIKRVIGLPGDTIEYKQDVLYINGSSVEEPYLASILALFKNKQLYTNDFTLEELTGQKVVPENHLFVLGDNRRNSIDSRQIGFIPMEEVVGRADIAYWPLEDFRMLK